MPDENTPLIQTVRVGPPRRRYPHQTWRRFFTLICSVILIGGFGLFVFQTFFIGPRHHHGHPGSWLPGKSRLSYEELERILFDTPDPKKAEEWSRYYTSGPHLAGANYSQVRTHNGWPVLSIKLISSRPSGPGIDGRNLVSSLRSWLMTPTSTIPLIPAFPS
jgi:N-acetylated-alpha-linked acidic dipeptidase